MKKVLFDKSDFLKSGLLVYTPTEFVASFK